MTTSNEPKTKRESVSNQEVARVYKEVQAEAKGWEEIGKRLNLKPNAAQGRVNTLKTQMFEALSQMVKADGSSRFTIVQMEDLILKAFPPIKRSGGGRTSDKKETIDSLIAALELPALDIE
jgi:hypothetical protein